MATKQYYKHDFKELETLRRRGMRSLAVCRSPRLRAHAG